MLGSEIEPGKSAAEAITRHIFHFGGDANAGQIRKIVACVQKMEPLTAASLRAHGAWPVVCALTALAVDLAAKQGDAAAAAALFENTARLLDFEARSEVARPKEPWDD